LFTKSDNVADATFKKRDSKKLVKKILATKIRKGKYFAQQSFGTTLSKKD